MGSYFFMDSYTGTWQSSVTGWQVKAPMGPGINIKIKTLMNYLKLNEYLLSKIYERKSASANAIVKNSRSALKRFMTYLDLSPESEVGPELLDPGVFEANIAGLLADLAISNSAKTDLRHRLRIWHRSALELKLQSDCPAVSQREAELMSKAISSKARRDVAFMQLPERKRLLYLLMEAKGLTAYRVEKEIGVSANTVRAWMYGKASPSRKDKIEKLEKLLGIEDDSLRLSLGVHPSLNRSAYKFVVTGPEGTLGGPLGRDTSTYGVGTESPVSVRTGRTVTAHSARVARTRSVCIPGIRRKSLSAEFEKEWWTFAKFKAASTAYPLKRTGRGCWTPRPIEQLPSMRHNKWAVLDGEVYPTADMQLGQFCRFFGFVHAPKKADGSGGHDIPLIEAQTIAWFAVSEVVEQYFKYLTTMSEGLKHGGQKSMMMLASGLCRKDLGFLPQHFHLVPNSFKQRFGLEGEDGKARWLEMCERSFQTAEALGRQCRDISRDPKEPIRDFISKVSAFSLIHLLKAADLLEKIADEAIARCDARCAAVSYRGALLFNILCIVPLRKANIEALTYRSDNSGQIQLEESGLWTIRIPQSAFKNRMFGKRKTDYTVTLPAHTSALLKKYLLHSRPYFVNYGGVQKSSNYLFVSERSPCWDRMTNYVKSMTKQFFPNSPGFAMHAFRHVVATFFLKRNPSEYTKVANLLNDTLRTVLENYAHNTVEESIESHLQGILNEARESGARLNLLALADAPKTLSAPGPVGVETVGGVLPPLITSSKSTLMARSFAMPKLRRSKAVAPVDDVLEVEDSCPRGGTLGAVGPSVGSAGTLVA